MQTECSTVAFDFQPHEKRDVRGIFDGGAITSDGGALLLREVEAKLRILGRFAECFTDHRDPELIEHSVGDLVAQRVFGLALGYEDLNDHDELQHDPLMAVLVGKQDPTGQDRLRQRDRGKVLAGKSTLNRLELSPPGANQNSRYKDFTYQTRKSWSRVRRVVGKAEHLAKGPNSRFVVTSLLKKEYDGRSLYEKLYCGRGDMENRIKEQQLMLFADRTSAEDMRANQIRLYFSSITYVLLSAMRRIGLAGTSLERAQCGTIRLKLLKIGALVRITVRKIWISFSQSYPYRDEFLEVLANIRRWQPVVLRC